MNQAIFSFNTKQLPLLNQVGGKARSLIQATQAGLPVPEGMVLSVAFFAPWTADIKASQQWQQLLDNPCKKNCDDVKQLAQQMSFSEQQRAEFNQALQRLNGDIWAVRSSSPEEDLKGSSFAGLYETHLGTSTAQLEQNIANAYSSMFDIRVMEYKSRQNIPLEHTSVAIIVQKQLNCDVSGVGFSLNPMNNCYDEAVINASFGLGEAIVSGVVTPDSYTVEKVRMEILDKTINNKHLALHLKPDGGIRQAAPSNPLQQALSDQQIQELTRLIKTCETYYQTPVDIEWAFAGDQLYLLQARPITTYIPLYPEMLTEPGARKKLYLDLIPLTQGFDTPLSVLGSDIWALVLEHLKAGSMPAGEDGYLLNIHGRQYIQLHNMFKGFGKKLGLAAPNTFANTLEGKEDAVYEEYVAQNKTDAMRRSRKAQLRAMWVMLPGIIGGFWNVSRQAQRMEAIVDSLIHKFQEMSNDRPFNERIDWAFAQLEVSIKNMTVYIAGLYSDYRIRRLIKGTEAEEFADAILMDLPSNPTSAMGHAMFKLAQFDEIQHNNYEQFLKAFNSGSVSHEFMNAWTNYMAAYGERGFREIDIASPRTREDIASFYHQLKSINTHNNQMLEVTKRKQQALESIRRVAQQKGKLKALEKHLKTIELAYGHRESPKYLVVVMNGNLRRVALDIADEFVAQGRLPHREQIFDLNKEQITQAQQDPSLNLQALIKTNLGTQTANGERKALSLLY